MWKFAHACCLKVLLVSQVGRAICAALPKTPTLIPQHRRFQDHELVAGDCHRADFLLGQVPKGICAVTVASDEFVVLGRCCGISVGVFGKATQMARPT